MRCIGSSKLRQLRIAEFGMRIWRQFAANPQSEIESHVHASEAGDVGDAIDAAELLDACG